MIILSLHNHLKKVFNNLEEEGLKYKVSVRHFGFWLGKCLERVRLYMSTIVAIKSFSGYGTARLLGYRCQSLGIFYVFTCRREIVQKGERITCEPSAHQLNPANEQKGFTQHVLANNGQLDGIFLMPRAHLWLLGLNYIYISIVTFSLCHISKP